MGLFYSATGKLPNPDGGRILAWIGLVVLEFVLALVFRVWWPEASSVLLNLFAVTFPAILVLLGIETVKAQS
jgi:hypothetical protein